MRRRPASASPASLSVRVVELLIAHAGRPCPTSDGMASALMVNRQAVRDTLQCMRARGVVEVEDSAPSGGFLRRMRVKRGEAWSDWTDWTKRAMPPRARAAVRGDIAADHVAAVVRCGSYG